MRNRDKVLDDLRCVQARDCTSLKKAQRAFRKVGVLVLSAIASRELPYGAKNPVEIDLEPPPPPPPRERYYISTARNPRIYRTTTTTGEDVEITSTTGSSYGATNTW